MRDLCRLRFFTTPCHSSEFNNSCFPRSGKTCKHTSRGRKSYFDFSFYSYDLLFAEFNLLIPAVSLCWYFFSLGELWELFVFRLSNSCITSFLCISHAFCVRSKSELCCCCFLCCFVAFFVSWHYVIRVGKALENMKQMFFLNQFYILSIILFKFLFIYLHKIFCNDTDIWNWCRFWLLESFKLEILFSFLDKALRLSCTS